MRLVFMGTPAFAAVCLSALLNDGAEICGVFTKPDTPQKRGMKLAQSEVKQLALSRGLPVFQPASLRDDAVYECLKELAPELIVVVAYGKLLPQRILDLPKYSCINIHGSILPALRGAAPVQWAVLNGLHETGVTAMYLSVGMDEGDVIDVSTTQIGESETAGELMERLALLGAELLVRTVHAMENGTAGRTPQDPALASYAPMLTKELSPIDWNATCREILCKIRGLNPWPIAAATFADTPFKIYEAEKAETDRIAVPGTVLALDRRGLVVACADGALRVTKLQAQGGKVMPAPDYFRGHPIRIPDAL